ncbi:MAG: LamG domain-containing protein [Bacteroidota bacterium]
MIWKLLFAGLILCGQITTLTGQNDCLVGDWPLDANAVDQSGNDLNGTVIGALPTTDRFGNDSSAYSFELEDWIEIGVQPTTDLTNNLTLQAWIFPTGPGIGVLDVGMIINREGTYQLSRWIDGTIRYSFANADPGWNHINTGIIAPENRWTCITLTYEDGTIKLYKNGVLEYTYFGSGPITFDNHPNLDNLRIGARTFQPMFFVGKIDDVQIYDCVLDEQDVQALCAFDPSTSVEQITDHPTTVKLFPNPVHDVLKIEAIGFEVHRMALFSASGSFIREYSGPRDSIQVGDLAPGMYVLAMYDEMDQPIAFEKVIR